MKPIHHALVSARLFGGTPEDYVALHTAFDMSKAALGDMRHRAALHSVDHGSAVMQMIFPERISQASLKELCWQHVDDDQGFQVRLDDWLNEARTPSWALVRNRPPAELAGFLEHPELACVKRWGGRVEDYTSICAYYTLPEQMSRHALAPAISRNAFGIFFSEMAFGPAIRVQGPSGKSRYVATRDIGECLALARFGRILSLGEVLDGLAKKDWMMGARVARSRQRRMRAAGRDDLFSDSMTGIGDQNPDALHSEASVFSVLSD